MRTLIKFIVVTLLGLMLTPAFGAAPPKAIDARVADVENAIVAQMNNLENFKKELENVLDAQQAQMDAEAQARKDLEAKVAKLQESLDNEVRARGTLEKLTLELQNELLTQKIRLDALQATLDQQKKDQAAAAAAIAQSLEKNTKQDKKDRTITYLMGLLLGGLAVSR